MSYIVPPPKPKPGDPRMGTAEETYAGSGTYYYAFGGEPNYKWTGLADPSERLLGDLCFRSLDPIAGQKSALVRTKSLDLKLTNTSKLSEFQKDVWKHLVKFGLDTIGYLPDPKDATEMQSVVVYHARYTGDLNKAIESSNDIRKNYDKWDKKHDYEAREFLLSSIAPEILKMFDPFHSNKNTFATTWLKLVHHRVTTTSETYDNMKTTIRRLTPQQYQGQNIEQLATKYIKMAEELDNAGHYEHSLTLNMVDGFLNADADRKGTYHFELNKLRSLVDEKRQATVFMSKYDQDDEFAKARLTFTDISMKAVKIYKDLIGNNKWEPGKLPKDRNTPPVNLTTAQVLQLIESVASKKHQSKSDSKYGPKKEPKPKGCFNCGDPGHIIKDCPKPKMTEEQSKAKRHESMSKWKLTPPSSSEPNSKQVNGKTFKWCKKCGNWTTTHDTNSHTGGTKTSTTSPSNNSHKKKTTFKAESNLTAWDPSAWIVEADYCDKTKALSIKSILLYLYIVITFGIYVFGLTLPPLDDLYSIATSTIQHVFSQIYNYHSYLMTSIAPVLWFTLGYSTCYLVQNQFDPVVDLVPATRALRRQNKPVKPRKKLKSAKDHGLIPKYPLRLRKDNVFNTRYDTPKLVERRFHALLDDYVHTLTLKSHHEHRSVRRPPLPHPSNSFDIESNSFRTDGRHIGKRAPRRHWYRTHKHNDVTSSKSRRGIPTCCENPTCGVHSRHSNTAPFQRVHHNAPSTKPNDIPSLQWGRKHKPVKVPKARNRHKHLKPRYKPTGIPTNHNLPNLNLTINQSNVRSKINQVFQMNCTLKKDQQNLAHKVSMLAPTCFKTAYNSFNKHKSFSIIMDTGASICVTPDKDDFSDYQKKPDINQVKGLGGKVSTVAGQGHVLWSVHDNTGKLRHFKLKAYHIPSAKTRLISTNELLNQYEGEHLTVDSRSMTLSGKIGDDNRSSVIAFNNPATNLPTLTAYRSEDVQGPAILLCKTVSSVHADNNNLSDSQKELLRWHQRLGHLAFKKIQHLMRTGVLSHTEATRSLHTMSSKLKEMPKCAACLFGKQSARPSPGSVTRVVKDRAGILRAGNLLPGSEVSVDHFISSVEGRLFTGFNRGISMNKYIGGCIFVDHASSHIHVEFQTSLSSHETLRAKIAYENQCRDTGVVVQKFMSDNGTAFTSRDFSEHLSAFHQINKFAGVGAHHHNAQAERAIRTIMSIARTMMIHAGIHWPDVSDSTLWPMAVNQACYLFNHVPNPDTGLSPHDIFTKTRWPQKKFHDLHVWGCPVYVLDKSIQDGKKIPKWKTRSDRSVYMGISASHASSVPLVLNVRTGAITPQFHIVFDDWFATVTSTDNNLPDFSSDEWHKMFGSSTYQYILDPAEEESSTSDAIDTLASNAKSDIIGQFQDLHLPASPLSVSEPATQSLSTGLRAEGGGSTTNSSKQAITPTTVPNSPPKASSSLQLKETPVITPQEFPNVQSPERKPSLSPQRKYKAEPIIRRSTRSSKPAERLTYSHNKKSLTHINSVTIPLSTIHYLDDYESMLTSDQIPDATVLLTSKAQSNPDLFDYSEAMNGENRTDWIKAASKEIRSLEELKCWEEIPIEEATTKILPGTWVFRVKRGLDGSFKKFKARYCIRGDLQEGDFDTYAPVVQFSSVRLFLAWSLMMNWETCCIDFSNAFIQATLKDPTFIHLPRGFSSNLQRRSCLRLKKSIYGLSVAPRLWFQHLLKALKTEGLTQSKHDPCLLLRNDLIIICYVDDLGIQAPNQTIIDNLISSIESKGFELTREGTFSEYLGIKYNKDESGIITMTQEGLIQKIIEATGMEECNSNRTPSIKEALGSDPEGESMTDEWNYRSVIGMLLYLSTNTRPDISFAVSQVARFSHDPKKSHATAVKMIVRYLSGTADKGVIYDRPKTFALNCFVDADFAGLYGKEPDHDPISVKSRTGYIISVGGCYILSKSQLQSTIALSTSESEYGALSQAMRAVLPLRETMLEMINQVTMKDNEGNSPFGNRDKLKTFETIIHEDNSSALSLANNQKVTSRTKHWSVKFHFFWSHLNDPKNYMKCIKVDTKEQRADYLTKGLTRELFENCRKLNQGW